MYTVRRVLISTSAYQESIHEEEGMMMPIGPGECRYCYSATRYIRPLIYISLLCSLLF